MRTNTVLLFFLSIFCSLLSAHAQSTYAPDEIVIEYVAGTTQEEKELTRAFYRISQYSDVAPDIELWYGIEFPFSFIENGISTMILSVEQFLGEIQETNDDSPNSPRANVGNGDLNYILSLVQDDVIYPNGTFDPLPFCDNSENSKLIGPLYDGNGSGGSTMSNETLDIWIIDQQMTNAAANTRIFTIQDIYIDWDNPDAPPIPLPPFQTGGSHGNKVYAVIDNILQQSNITNVRYNNCVIFDYQGTSNYARLLSLISFLGGTTDESIAENAILNFSANMVISEADENLILWDLWDQTLQDRNLLLISSAGNEGWSNANVYPAGANWSHEISVAGTEDCFSSPWEGSNSNANNFDIAAEATGILTQSNGQYFIVNGTSFSSAFVTAAAAQIAARCPTFDALFVKDQILNHADINPNLFDLVQDGKMLNTTASINNMEPCTPPTGGGGHGGNGGEYGGKTLNNKPTSSPLSLQTTPNPFSQNARISIGVPVGEDAEVSLYNSIGQMVHQERIPNQQELKELEWITPNHLPKGTYFVRVQAGDQQAQQMIVKQ